MRNGLLVTRNEVGNLRVILGPEATLAECVTRFKELAVQPSGADAVTLELHAIDGNSLAKRVRLPRALPVAGEAEPVAGEAEPEEAPRKSKK